MKKIANIFELFFKFISFFGFFPFVFTHDGRTTISNFRIVHSILMTVFFFVMFSLFTNSATTIRNSGSELSTTTAILHSMIALMTGILITGTNLLNFKNFEELFKIFWNFDVKVIHRKFKYY